jgi:pyocin large subunit-like protein
LAAALVVVGIGSTACSSASVDTDVSATAVQVTRSAGFAEDPGSSNTNPANTRVTSNTKYISDVADSDGTVAESDIREDIGFRNSAKLEQHYQKHGREFGSISKSEYLRQAQVIRDSPLSDRIIQAEQVGGTLSRFDRQTGGFIAFDRDGTLRTYFRPNDGEDYFWRAAKKNH